MKTKPCPCENCIGKHPECQDNCKSYAIWLDTYDDKIKKNFWTKVGRAGELKCLRAAKAYVDDAKG